MANGAQKKPATTTRHGKESRAFAIVQIDLTKPKGDLGRETHLPVTSVFCGVPVTEAMVTQEVSNLNYYCGRDGKSGEDLGKGRTLAFRLVKN